MAANVKHLPPLIALHGEADMNVPIAEGRRLIELGKSVGAETEFVPYPAKAHGFDFSDTDPMTSDAIDRVTRFPGEACRLTASAQAGFSLSMMWKKGTRR